MYICVCNAVTENQVRSCVDAGAETLGDLQYELGVATCCGRCAETALEYLPGGRCSSVCNAHVGPARLPSRAPALASGTGSPAAAANVYSVIMIEAA
jgi:bacterioferritin-associated ferredoxin